MRSCRLKSSALFFLLLPFRASALPGPASPEAWERETIFAPLEAELSRSLKNLKTGTFEPPYFIAYRVVDQDSLDLSASFGALTRRSQEKSRTLYAEVRVGSPSLDNTDLSFHGWSGFGGMAPAVLRRHAWVLTDGAYRGALSGFLEKKARRATEFVPDVLDDFSAETPSVHRRGSPPSRPDPEPLKRLVERLSAVFARRDFLYAGGAALQWSWGRRYLLTSEGTRIAGPKDNVPGLLRLSAMTRAPDGMRLDNHKSWTFTRPEELPPESQLAQEAERLASQLSDLRRAPVQAPMTAPAILDPEFTGVLFHEALGHKLEGQRQRDPQQSQVFKDLVGKKIIPEFITVTDDPSLKEFKGVPLSGHYEFDSEGVASRRVPLVEKGVLKNFLMSRWPVKGFARSNGHGRAGASRHPSGRMSNLIVAVDDPQSPARLKIRLQELARKAGKPYGFRLVGSFGGENPNSRGSAQTLEVLPRLLYRIDAETGEETLVRGVKMTGTPLVVLNRILAGADDASLANGFTCGAESGHVPVSQISPSVLISEVELQRLPEDRSLPPLLPSPAPETETR